MLRTSSYVIYVDLPGNSDEMLIVQTYTGAFDKVSRRVATYVRSLEPVRPPKPLYGDWSPEPPVDGAVQSPSQETVDLLCRRGYLTALTKEQEEDFFRTYVEKIHTLFARRWPSYLFMPTYDCNLRCPYCFQDHMRTDPNMRHLLRRMTPAMVDRIFAAMPKIEALHGVPPEAEAKFEIGLFGGEPLLADNRSIVEYILQKGKARGDVGLWAISNGTELDAYEDLIGPGMLGQIQITLDGPPSQHNQRRIYPDGSGSWDRIVRNVKMALDRNAVVMIRTNADRNNIDDLYELAAVIVENGWERYPNFGSQVAPIRAANDKTDAKGTMSTWDLDRRLTEMREKDPRTAVLGRIDDPMRNQAYRIFTQRGFPSFKPSFCSAHTGMYIFDAFGDIYACWEKTGDEKVRIGHVDEASELHFNFDVKAMWRGRTVASNPVCLKCRYNLYCGGGCAVLAMEHHGFYSNYCDGFAHRFRASVADAYSDFATGKIRSTQAESFCDL